jgi:hypothetical protein
MKKSVKLSLSATFVLIHALNGQTSGCSPKFRGDDPSICDTLAAKGNGDFLIFNIQFIRPPLDSADDSAHQATLKRWTRDLFTNFDLRLLSDSTQRLAVPPDSLINWSTGMLYITKETALNVAADSSIFILFYRSTPPTTVIFTNTLSTPSLAVPKSEFFDVTGRQPRSKIARARKLYFPR